jgi:hypothetical protein
MKQPRKRDNMLDKTETQIPITEKEKEKLLPRVEGIGKSSTYTNKNIRFSFVVKVGDIRKQASGFSTCRDHVNDTMRAFIHKTSDISIYNHKTSPPLDMETMRLLIAKDCDNRKERYEFKERIFSAKRLINMYEKLGGWEKPSVISTVRMEGGNAKNVWMLTGPKQWVSYAQLMSMVTLIFRVIANYGPIEFTDYRSAEAWFSNLLDEYNEKKSSGMFNYSADLETYLKNSWQKFHMLVTRYDEIFTQPLDEAFPKHGGFHTAGGINSLCTFETDNKVLDDNMRRVWAEEYKKRKKWREEIQAERDNNPKIAVIEKTF